MSGIFFVIFSILGILASIGDYLICELVQDGNTSTARTLSEFFDFFMILLYLATVAISCCKLRLTGTMGKIAVFLTMGVVTEFSSVVGYGLFTGIWNQGQQEHMDFYKEVAILVLIYVAARFLVIIGFLLCFLNYILAEGCAGSYRTGYEIVRTMPYEVYG